MPTFVNAHPWLKEAVLKAGGQVVRIGSKPWAHFHGDDAKERAKAVEAVYQQVHGRQCHGVGPWRKDQQFNYAMRLD